VTQFAVQSIVLKDLGAFVDVNELDLQSFKSTVVLFGSNGAGKTTVLEAVSTIGHLPCLPIWDFATGEISASLLREVTGTSHEFAGQHWSSLLVNCPADPYQGLRPWLDASRLKNWGYGAFLINLVDEEDLIEFAVVVKARKSTAKTEGNATLTPILSQDSGRALHEVSIAGKFDPTSTFSLGAATEGEQRQADDFSLEQDMIVLPGSKRAFRVLNEAVLRGRTFMIRGKSESLDGNPSWGDSLETATGVRRVTYINSDLNDFGRGNDLRESPKLLTRSFDRSLTDRLQIPFEEGKYRYTEQLNEILTDTLPDDQLGYSDVWALREPLREVQIRQTSEGKIDFRIEKGNFSIQPETLSAGENEIVFLSLAVQSAVRSGDAGARCIVLLDEPDLHLDHSARERFLIALLKATDRNGQTLIASHSAAAMTAIRKTWKGSPQRHLAVLYKHEVPTDPYRRGGTSDPIIRTSLSYDPRPLAAVNGGARGGFGKRWLHTYRSVQLSAEALLSSPLGGPLYRSALRMEARAISFLAVFFVPFVLIVSGINDLADFLGLTSKVAMWLELESPPEELVDTVHTEVGRAFLVFAGVALGVLAQYAVMRYERRRARGSGWRYMDETILWRSTPSFVIGVFSSLAVTVFLFLIT